jgi:hypothetical protein
MSANVGASRYTFVVIFIVIHIFKVLVATFTRYISLFLLLNGLLQLLQLFEKFLFLQLIEERDLPQLLV